MNICRVIYCDKQAVNAEYWGWFHGATIFHHFRCKELKLFENHVRFYWRRKKSIWKKKKCERNESICNKTGQVNVELCCTYTLPCNTCYTQHISLLSCYFSVKIHFLPFSKSLFHFMTATDVYVMRTLNTIFFSFLLSLRSLLPQSHSIHAFTNKRKTTQRKIAVKISVEWEKERTEKETDSAEKRAV